MSPIFHLDDSADEQDETMKYSPEDMDAMSSSPRSHLPNWPKKPPPDETRDKEADGYMYSNNNDPGAEAQAREDAERAYKAAMAEREEGFRRYMAVQAEIAKEKERAANAARQEVENLLVGSGQETEKNSFFISDSDAWADGSDDENLGNSLGGS